MNATPSFLLHWAGIILLLVTAHAADGQPSFDCAKAQTPIEQLICRDEGLARLDQDLSNAYKEALQARNIDKAAEAAWIRRRDKACSTEEPQSCLRSFVEQHIAELRAGAIYGAWEPGSAAFEGDGNIDVKKDSISWRTCKGVPYRVLSYAIMKKYPGMSISAQEVSDWKVVLLRVADSPCFRDDSYIQFAIPTNQKDHADISFYSSPEQFAKGYFAWGVFGKVAPND